MRHAFTVDAEDWPQLMCSYLGHETPVSEQFVGSIQRTLDLLDAHRTRATFFVVAPHAAQRPEVVREIVARGHEAASHGATHAKVHTFSPQKFRDDLRRSIDTLEEITGEKIRGYRAPFFSMMPEQCWAWEVMLDCGLDYDSSLTTLLWQAEGVAVPDGPFLCDLPSEREIIEVPALARKVGPITGRLIGGRTLRVLPRSITRSHMREREAHDLPAMLYVHSYEVTPDRLMEYLPGGLSLLDRAKLFFSARAFELGMGRMSRALGELGDRFDWAPMRDVVDQLRASRELPRVAVRCNGEVVAPPSAVSS
ncbi:MAG: polysaccharide deacetylase family protein [Armatimonadota bacterium]|jgi:polysaccharide deacetylase family protein (PEP-CTERM system associated)